jgi:hypothetical protein
VLKLCAMVDTDESNRMRCARAMKDTEREVHFSGCSWLQIALGLAGDKLLQYQVPGTWYCTL